jgi:ribonuclease Z
MYGKLQSGQSIHLPDGTEITPARVLGPPRRGRSVVFATDTRPCSGLDTLLTNADIAFVEGMFALEHREEAAEKKHSTAADTAQAAAKAGVKKLVLVHISPRYSYEDEATLKAEAAAHFADVDIGRGLASYEVKLPD